MQTTFSYSTEVDTNMSQELWFSTYLFIPRLTGRWKDCAIKHRDKNPLNASVSLHVGPAYVRAAATPHDDVNDTEAKKSVLNN